jgi:hypothetical protein
VLWAALTVDERTRAARGRYLTVIGRLREGVSLAQAHDEMARLGEQLAAENQDLNAGWGVNVQPLTPTSCARFARGSCCCSSRWRCCC